MTYREKIAIFVCRLSRIAVLTGAFGASFAHAGDESAQFEMDKAYRQERVRDFYERLDDKDRQDVDRRRGEDEKRVERKKTAIEDEEFRREFVKARRERAVEDPTAFERELKQRREEHELSRQEFVKARDAMNKVLKQSGDVPEEDEYELYFDQEP